MEDYKIVDLYWQRLESAISETENKYGRMLEGISYSLLKNNEDSEECVNDTYMEAWNRMPNDKPTYLGAYLSKITRCLSINRLRASTRQKRGGKDNIIEELTECVSDNKDITEEYENGRLKEALDFFVSSLDTEKRTIFLQRYFYAKSITEISRDMSISESKTKTTLFRIRESLRVFLENKGLFI